jgi:hypothetical protein
MWSSSAIKASSVLSPLRDLKEIKLYQVEYFSDQS